ncbi:hypothetical protein NIA71_03160 [Ihubacter massiliensis]|uniref:Uncharacterized protein n=1 Tax=Hominibacterium faecale TaxID=2839743 RepID=A0A9J6QTE7_9FIRM|nr:MULTISPECIES: hypothetical protein [Eubacteriales Family XIII. Incertae Sedis]MCB6367334.1 hypothetical protein [Intestinibacillus massiliensis]MCC2865329.1 hypothetical protein [Anaerovorax odorimutans]MDE8732873.1 hypothetical protein [Eubacteriales bacterium DFI.9.88]MCO7120947.1 hypothetical protein [Ihubacter massiliensis]MCU7377863.1 hypothetical protein [Hominibacterium faecale]
MKEEYEFGPERPGNFTVSEKKLKKLCPELYGTGKFNPSKMFAKSSIKRFVKIGDCQPAVVLKTKPLMVAAFADELDCIAMLRFPEKLADTYELVEGSRLLSVNTYTEMEGMLCADLDKGPEDSGIFEGFQPIIIQFLSDEESRMEEIMDSFEPVLWEKAFQLGKEYMRSYPGVFRDGNPLRSEELSKDSKRKLKKKL